MCNTTMIIMHIQISKNGNSFKKLKMKFWRLPIGFFVNLAFWINES